MATRRMHCGAIWRSTASQRCQGARASSLQLLSHGTHHYRHPLSVRSHCRLTHGCASLDPSAAISTKTVNVPTSVQRLRRLSLTCASWLSLLCVSIALVVAHCRLLLLLSSPQLKSSKEETQDQSIDGSAAAVTSFRSRMYDDDAVMSSDVESEPERERDSAYDYYPNDDGEDDDDDHDDDDEYDDDAAFQAVCCLSVCCCWSSQLRRSTVSRLSVVAVLRLRASASRRQRRRPRRAKRTRAARSRRSARRACTASAKARALGT